VSRSFWQSLFAAASLWPALASGAETAAAVTQSVSPGGWRYSATAREEYRFRHASARADPESPPADPSLALESLGAESDHDLRLRVYGDAREPSDRLSAELSLSLLTDLDGVASSGAPIGLRSIHEQDVWFDVYTLAGQYRSHGFVKRVRVGRQVTEHGESATFDGALVETRPDRRYLELFAFGGRTVHFFEVDASVFEDWVASLGAVSWPLDDLKLELDYRFLHEDTMTADAVQDHTVGLAAWYRVGDWLHIRPHLRTLNSDIEDVGGRINLESERHHMGIAARADVQPATLREINETDDPLFAVLGESLPNARLRVDAWKAVPTGDGTFSLHAGWNARLLLDDTPTQFNRDSGRVFVMIEGTDIGARGPFASLISEMDYTSDAGEGPGGRARNDSAFSLGGTAGYDTRTLRAEVGTYYARFKYDYYRDINESASVRTWYGAIRYEFFHGLRAHARHEYEQSVDRDVHTLTLALSQRY